MNPDEMTTPRGRAAGISSPPVGSGGMQRTAAGQRVLAQPSPASDRPPGQVLAQGLGWYSIGLGLAQLIRPGALARLCGVADDPAHRLLLRVCGARELAAGLGIISQDRPAGWLWFRVLGDVLDLGLLATAMRDGDNARSLTAAVAGAKVGVTALDVIAARQQSRALADQPQRGIALSRTTTINRSPAEVYAFWRDLSNLPRFMRHLDSVEVLDGKRSKWCATGPAGLKAEWEAVITEERTGELIAWRSVEGSTVETLGVVRFAKAPGGRGTEVRVELRYQPPGGRIGAAFAALFGEAPSVSINSDLRRLKQVLEIGEVVRSDASLHEHPHPGQPTAEAVAPQPSIPPVIPAKATRSARATRNPGQPRGGAR